MNRSRVPAMTSETISFFDTPPPLTLADIVRLTGAEVAPGVNMALSFRSVAPIDRAGPNDLTFLENAKYADMAEKTLAHACLVGPRLAQRLPAHTIPLIAKDPYRSLAAVSAAMYPKALRPSSIFGVEGISPGSNIHPQARLEPGVTVDPGVVIGAGAEIGRGTTIAANAVIGPNVRIGRDCYVGPSVTVIHALIGNRVMIHGGVSIGQDGFGFAMGGAGHMKVPQIGRVVIQDDVEIGANSCIDRGTNRDTIIGEGSKIDNLVQIAHNVTIGRHCVIAAMAGVSGSTVLDDFVVLGGQVGIAGHLHIAMGVQVAGSSAVMDNIPAGGRWGGVPARPMRQWFRELTALKNSAKKGKPVTDGEPGGD